MANKPQFEQISLSAESVDFVSVTVGLEQQAMVWSMKSEGSTLSIEVNLPKQKKSYTLEWNANQTNQKSKTVPMTLSVNHAKSYKILVKNGLIDSLPAGLADAGGDLKILADALNQIRQFGSIGPEWSSSGMETASWTGCVGKHAAVGGVIGAVGGGIIGGVVGAIGGSAGGIFGGLVGAYNVSQKGAKIVGYIGTVLGGAVGLLRCPPEVQMP